MTMVLAYKFKDGTVMVSDSRATWVDKRINTNVPEDCQVPRFSRPPSETFNLN